MYPYRHVYNKCSGLNTSCMLLGTYHNALFLSTKVVMGKEPHFFSCPQVSHEFALNFNPNNPYCAGKSPILQRKVYLSISREARENGGGEIDT